MVSVVFSGQEAVSTALAPAGSTALAPAGSTVVQVVGSAALGPAESMAHLVHAPGGAVVAALPVAPALVPDSPALLPLESAEVPAPVVVLAKAPEAAEAVAGAAVADSPWAHISVLLVPHIDAPVVALLHLLLMKRVVLPPLMPEEPSAFLLPGVQSPLVLDTAVQSPLLLNAA